MRRELKIEFNGIFSVIWALCVVVVLAVFSF